MFHSTTLQDVLIDEVKDLYSAETQLVRALPNFVRAGNNLSLKTLFAEHLSQTRIHVERLKEVADHLGGSATGRTCHTMHGLIAEGEDYVDSIPMGDTRDASLLCLARKIEHYEIAGYGSVRSIALTLRLHRVVVLLQATLDEESDEDRELSGLADFVNSRAESPHDLLSVVS